MPKLKDNIVNRIIEILKSEQYKNCSEIADQINKEFNLKITRRIVGDINKGLSHHNDALTYPISKKYARGFLTTCCICGKKSEAEVNGKEYCHKHYMQLYHHGEILDETIYDKNEFIEHNDYVEIILKNKFFEPIAITKVDKDD